MSTIAQPPKPLNPALVDSEGYIDWQIKQTRRALKFVDLAGGILTLTIGLLAFILVGAVIDHWIVPGGLSVGGRGVLFGFLLVGAAWYGWRQLLVLWRPINPVYAAHVIEQGAPSLKNSLLNLLLFRGRREQMSVRVYHALEQQAAQRLSSAPLDTAVDRSALLRLGYALLLIVAACALYAALSPKDMVRSAGRVLAPWSDIAAPSRVQILDLKPGASSVARGERVEVSAEIHGLHDDESVRLRYSTADEQTVDESIRMDRPSPEARRFRAYLPRGTDAGVEQDLSYWIEAGDARSPKYKLTVFSRPTIVVQKIRYDYPAYTGFPSKQTNNIGDIRGVEGTRVTISALANQPIKNAQVDFDADGSPDMRMNVDGDRATATFTLGLRNDRRTPLHGSYMLRFTSINGRKNIDPPKYSIDVTPDYEPEIRITEPEAPEQVARMDDVVPIGVEARDPDFALSSVKIVGQVDGRQQTLFDLLERPHAGRFGIIKSFMPGDAGLKPGDVLEYWAEANDVRRPEANVAFSEHRRLKIIGPDKPQDQNQQPPNDGQRQPDNQQGSEQGENQNNGQGGGQQGGQGGENAEGAEGDQQGSGGTAGGEGQPQDQQGPGGKGKAGESSAGDAQQQPGSAGGTDGENMGENADESQSESSASGSERNSDQSSKSNDGTEPNASESQAGEQGEAGQAGDRQQPSAGAEPSKVSSVGDNDGEAFQRMAEHFNEHNQPSGGQSQPGENQQTGESQQPGKQPNQGDQKSSAGAEQPSPPPGQNGGVKDGSQQQKPSAADASGAQQGQPGEAAGSSQRPAGQKPPAEGTQRQGPHEQAGDTQQQPPAGEQNSSPRQGADAPREAEPGDGNRQDDQGAEQPSPDSAMNRDNGNSGAGHSTGEEQGSPGGDEAHRQGRDKAQDDNRSGENDQTPPGGSPDKRESDSQGGQSGEQSGGGQEGAGQQADAAGKGGAGQHEAADEGAGRADEQGQGESGKQAGRDQLADGQTGESSGDQPGQGSRQDASGRQSEAGSKDEPAEAGDNDQSSAQSADSAAPNSQQAAAGKGQADPSTGQRPNESPLSDASQPLADGQQSTKNSSDQSSNHQSSAGSAQPQGGGSGGTNAASMPPPPGDEQAGDEANLEFARQQTDLVLEQLDNQLAKKQVDRNLLKRLGWTEAELQRFVDRWKELKARAANETDATAAAKQELDDALRSLGLRSDGPLRFQGQAKADDLRANDAYRVKPPAEYADRVREYAKGISTRDSE